MRVADPQRKNNGYPLAFITRDVSTQDGPYFIGFETFRPLGEEDVRIREDANTIKKLKRPYDIDENHGLWLSPNGGVWLASASDPIGDGEKLLISEDPMS